MTEPFANEDLTAYLDGELPEAERLRFEAQLAADEALRDELEALRGASAFVRRHAPVQAPDDFLDQIMNLVDEEPANVNPGPRRWFGIRADVWMVTAAAAAVLLVVVPAGGALSVGGFLANRAASVGSYGSPEAPGSIREKAPPAAISPSPEEAWKVSQGKDKDIEVDGEPLQNAYEYGRNNDVDAVTVSSGWRVTTGDRDVVGSLAKVVAEYGGEVGEVQELPQKSGLDQQSVTVRIPPSAIDSFSRDLGKLGSVQRFELKDPVTQAGELVALRVDFVVEGGGGNEAGPIGSPNAAPPQIKSVAPKPTKSPARKSEKLDDKTTKEAR